MNKKLKAHQPTGRGSTLLPGPGVIGNDKGPTGGLLSPGAALGQSPLSVLVLFIPVLTQAPIGGHLDHPAVNGLT